MAQHWVDGVALTQKVIEKDIEGKDWDMWVSVYPTMTEETFVSFDKFRKRETKSNKNKFTNDEIIAQAEATRLLHQGKHKGIVKEGR